MLVPCFEHQLLQVKNSYHIHLCFKLSNSSSPFFLALNNFLCCGISDPGLLNRLLRESISMNASRVTLSHAGGRFHTSLVTHFVLRYLTG